MAFGMFGNTPPPIGIEFGTHSLKALQIDSSGGRPAIIGAASLETPERLLTDERGRMTFQAENLPDLLRAGGFRGKRVISALPAKQTIVQHIQVQKAEASNLASAVQSQLQMQAGIDPRQAVIRHIEVGDFTRAGAVRTEVICFAVARDVVFRQIEALRGAKLSPAGIHSSQLAAARAFDRITRRQEDRDLTTLFIDIGAGTTKVVITHGRDLAFAKTIDVAGRVFDEVCAKQLDCGLLEARSRRLALAAQATPPASPAPREESARTDGSARRSKTARGGETAAAGALAATMDRREHAPAPGVTPDVSTDSPVRLTCGRIDLSEPLEWLTDEVAMCLRHHRSLFRERKIDRAIFLGGESRHTGMCQQIARALRAPSQIADPLSHLAWKGRGEPAGVDLSKPQPGWAVPLGLCHCPMEM